MPTCYLHWTGGLLLLDIVVLVAMVMLEVVAEISVGKHLHVCNVNLFTYLFTARMKPGLGFLGKISNALNYGM